MVFHFQRFACRSNSPNSGKRIDSYALLLAAELYRLDGFDKLIGAFRYVLFRGQSDSVHSTVRKYEEKTKSVAHNTSHEQLT